MKKLHKIIAVLSILALVLSSAACAKKDAEPSDTAPAGGSAKYTVGIVQLIQHVALDAATKGFRDYLTEEFGDNITFLEQNAQGDSNTCATIANGFVSSKVDLILANATPALIAAAAATSEIPILGTSITSYADAFKIQDFNGVVGGNVSGTSDLAPLDQQAQMILDLFPETKKVGIIYCSGEPNSIYQVNIVKEYLEGKGVEVTLYPFADSNDIAAVTTTAAKNSDAIYIPTDNAAASNAKIIDNICRPAKVPVIAGEQGICRGCGVATLSIDYYDLGYTTGKMAAKILKGEADISTMPIEYAPKFTKMYNAEICEDLGITIPEGYEPIPPESE
ncbi:MAG TPA: ABC transporter substrate-binding protein [Clostridiales bacterium]|nr:ABC transporter substrate-binding protein [Clostridiales bacterium]HPU66562.1 ABC transporter substrate-binding protein [Clostridiales bacterium]HQD71840.1 ABC transporter substrate-binding protein [Clostridiales bacterium]